MPRLIEHHVYRFVAERLAVLKAHLASGPVRNGRGDLQDPEDLHAYLVLRIIGWR